MTSVGRTEATSPTCDHVIVSDIYRCDECHLQQAVPVEWREKPREVSVVRPGPLTPVFDRFKRLRRLDGFGYGTDEI
jgi:hypothetical protein